MRNRLRLLRVSACCASARIELVHTFARRSPCRQLTGLTLTLNSLSNVGTGSLCSKCHRDQLESKRKSEEAMQPKSSQPAMQAQSMPIAIPASSAIQEPTASTAGSSPATGTPGSAPGSAPCRCAFLNCEEDFILMTSRSL